MKADAQFGGCLVGAYHTVRFKVKLSNLGVASPGANKITFRFEGTNGEEMGFRVLNIDLLAGNKSVLVPNQFEQDNPDNWTPPLNNATDIAAGKNLFLNGVLYESPLNKGKILNGKCASCHATDARDLSYFNFSNKSIIYRSMFHGLTENQGKQIASYVRSLNLKIPSGYSQKDLGRPWNPPYQPGVGLDSKPQMFWSAGAGVEAVLDDDQQMRDYLFSGAKTAVVPGAAKTYNINGYNGYINPREMPQPIQFPDWMMWLPKTAPEDRVANTSDWFNSESYKNYASLRDTILPDPVQQKGEIEAWHYFHLLKLSDSQQPTFLVNWDVTVPTYTREQSLAATREYMNGQTWYALRQWELLNTFGLEELKTTPWNSYAKSSADVIGQRQWPIFARNVFHLAPHFSGPMNTSGVTFNGTPVGQFFSTSWYTMQMILNPGYRMGAGQEHPVDWNYHPNHIQHTEIYGSHFPKQPYRWFASVQFRTQIQRNDLLTDPSNNYFARYLYSFRHMFDGLGVAMSESLPKDKQLELVNQSIITVLEEMENYNPAVFPRKGSGLNGQQEHFFEPADFVIPLASTGFEDDFYGRKATRWFAATREANIMGIPTQTVERMKNFGKIIWPLSDWDSIDTSNR